MKILSVFLFFALSVTTVINAADTAPPAGAPAASVAPIDSKNQSSFNLEDNTRNPFWPIGWKPVAKLPDNGEHTGPDILPGAFAVTSITLDPGAHFAIINGKAMSEGQQFGLQIGNQTYQLTIKAIEDGQVVLMRRDQEIIVPLRRK